MRFPTDQETRSNDNLTNNNDLYGTVKITRNSRYTCAVNVPVKARRLDAHLLLRPFCFGSTFLTFLLRYFDIIKLLRDIFPNFLVYWVCEIFASSPTPISPLNWSMTWTRWFLLPFSSNNYFFQTICFHKLWPINRSIKRFTSRLFFRFLRYRCVCSTTLPMESATFFYTMLGFHFFTTRYNSPWFRAVYVENLK